MTSSLKAKQLLAQRILARRRLVHFTKLTHPSYEAGWVHEDICARLERFSQDVSARKSPRLMLLMPPRHGKSELASIRFPAWHLGHNPEHEIINVGYNLDLPMKFSRKVREVLRDQHYQAMFPNTKLDPDSQGAEAWNTLRGGGFTAAGVGGGITGKGAHILLIDDPLKNQEEADSAERRLLLEEWYESTAYTRLAPGGGVLIIETWWNDDDLAGRLQAKATRDPRADQFEVVKYPAISEQYEYRHPRTLKLVRSLTPIVTDPEETDPEDGPDPVTGQFALPLTPLRAPNQCLHESRYPLEALERIRSNLQPRVWSALYQQNPVPDEGMYFRKEYFRHQISLPESYGLRVFTAWDFAIGIKQANDYTVGVTLLQDHNDVLYVLDVNRFKADSMHIVEHMLDTYVRYGTLDPRSGAKIGPADYQLGVEDSQIWKSIKPLLERRMAERKLFPSVQTLKPLTDKMARARPLQGRMQQGRVVFPKEASWLPATEMELLRFPAGAHDDIVDAMAWATHLVLTSSPPAPLPQLKHGKPVVSWRERLDSLSNPAGASHMAA